MPESFPLGWFDLASWPGASGLAAPLANAVAVILCLLPGVALSLRTRPGDAIERLAHSVILSGFLGYVCFWVYYFSPQAGRGFTVVVLLGSVVAVARAAWRSRAAVFPAPFFRLVGVQIAVVTIYGAAMNLAPFVEGNQLQLANVHFFPQWQDNLFQTEIAARLSTGESVARVDLWRLADRPPLQAGMMLLSGGSFFEAVLWRQAMGVAINTSWLIALAYLGMRIGLDWRGIGRALWLCALVGFFFNSSVFIWPKLVAGALVVLGAAYWWYAEPGERWGERLWLGIVAWGCAWFAHPSTGFALALALVCGGVVAWRMVRHPSRFHVWTVAVLLLTLGWLIVPWSVYKRLDGFEPHVLLTYHLGGVFMPDLDGSAAQVILSSYADRPWGEILNRKLNNLRVLFLPMGDYGEGALGWRQREYYHLFIALGLLNVGWFVGGFRLLAQRRRETPRTPLDLGRLAAPGIGALVLLTTWMILEFGPSQAEMTAWVEQSFNPAISVTILHQGSYAPYLVLAFLAAVLTQSLPTWAWRLAAGTHLAVFGWFYVLTPRDLWSRGEVQLGAAGLLTLGLAGLAWLCLRRPRAVE